MGQPLQRRAMPRLAVHLARRLAEVGREVRVVDQVPAGGQRIEPLGRAMQDRPRAGRDRQVGTVDGPQDLQLRPAAHQLIVDPLRVVADHLAGEGLEEDGIAKRPTLRALEADGTLVFHPTPAKCPQNPLGGVPGCSPTARHVWLLRSWHGIGPPNTVRVTHRGGPSARYRSWMCVAHDAHDSRLGRLSRRASAQAPTRQGSGHRRVHSRTGAGAHASQARTSLTVK